MADLKISALTSSATAPADTDVFPTVESMGGTPATKRKAWSVLEAAIEHGKIANIGTHTHAQIDTHLGFVGASAHLSATLGTTVANAEVLVHLDTELYDIGSDFDAATSHLYTVPVAGYYLAVGHVGFGAVADQKNGYGIISVDGVWEWAGAQNASGTTNEFSSAVVYVAHFNAAQTIGLYYYHTGATTVDILAAYTFLAVTLLNPD